MKKGINAFWIVLVLLNIFVIVSSHNWCVKYIPTGYNGLALAVTEDGKTGWNDLNGGIIEELPAPKPISLAKLTIFPAVFGIIMFLFKAKWLHIIAIIAEFFETLLLFGSAKLLNDIQMIGCSIGGLTGYYKLTFLGYLTGIICLFSIAVSIIMTTQCKREKPTVSDKF